MRTIIYGNEYMDLYDDGSIGRPSIGMSPSGKWRITGAATINNFGKVVKLYSLADILRDPGAIPWKFKNGVQHTFVRDIDHGTYREWRTPHAIM